jgi:hypothetical protein
MPLSASLRIPTIWLSLNFDFRITAPNPEQSTFGCQAIGEAYGGAPLQRRDRERVSLGVSEPNMSCAFAAAKIRVTSDARLMIAKTRFRVDAWIIEPTSAEATHGLHGVRDAI